MISHAVTNSEILSPAQRSALNQRLDIDIIHELGAFVKGILVNGQ